MLWLLCLCLMACWARADSDRKFEVELIFPRNDTYAPMPLMPIVFAIRNPSLADQLHAYLEYGVYPLDRPSKPFTNERFYMHDDLFDHAENETIYYSYSGVPITVNTTGSWEFFWRLRYVDCSISDDPEYYNEPYPWLQSDHFQEDFHLGYHAPVIKVIFTTSENGTVPNLTTISSDKDCHHGQWGLFKPIQEMLKVPFPLSDEGVSECASFNTSVFPPIPTSCQVDISHEVESSILAEITHRECYSATPAVSCPTAEPTKKSIATGHDHAQAAWLAITLAFTLAFCAVVH